MEQDSSHSEKSPLLGSVFLIGGLIGVVLGLAELPINPVVGAGVLILGLIGVGYSFYTAGELLRRSD